MKDLVSAFIAEAVGHFTASTEKAELKKATKALSDMLKQWNMLDKQVRQTIGALLSTMRQSCKHEGARRGHNERDGSWMAPCPTCGDSF